MVDTLWGIHKKRRPQEAAPSAGVYIYIIKACVHEVLQSIVVRD